ncbi:hypothetical protein [Kribbella catacumbae]|uniref:hypothetical protein n=1 Tax=Kribbella catacumbae TaxID=460086 RepID=UPI00192ABE29|nr:hypothetical protein [Kribbella catacumbae]
MDTGALVAAVLSADGDHRACVDLFASAHLGGEQLVVPSFVAREIATLDRRDFRVVRPRHVDAFTLLP